MNHYSLKICLDCLHLLKTDEALSIITLIYTKDDAYSLLLSYL